MPGIILDQFRAMEAWIRTGSFVMIPLLLVSIVMWTLIINRFFFFRRLYRKNMSREQAGRFIENNELPPEDRYRGAIAFVVTSFLKKRTGRPEVDTYILDEATMESITILNKYLAFIGVLAGAAPLLGLLGTVTGMIATFDIISVFGTGNARAMAGGISEALVTTQTGLVIAIPGLYMHGFLEKRADELKTRISSTGIYLQRYIKQETGNWKLENRN
ncbi:MAG: MotA/TolQ/ExbB proton channel family protein [Thermodesulfobacteriota bacterium]|nr:MotA/TolQ/ExbB proton channel family protein [Thermodesulfobacteriota bacterium]